MPKYNISDYNEEGNGTREAGDDNLREIKMKNRQQLYLHLEIWLHLLTFFGNLFSFKSRIIYLFVFFFFFYITSSQTPLSKYVIFSLATFEKELFL